MAIARNHQAEYSHWRPEEVKLIDGMPVHFSDVCVHEFTVADVEDPDIYAAGPIWDWQNSEIGAWVIEHAASEPYYVQFMDINSLSYKFRIMARLSDKDQVFWRLKWGGRNK